MTTSKETSTLDTLIDMASGDKGVSKELLKGIESIKRSLESFNKIQELIDGTSCLITDKDGDYVLFSPTLHELAQDKGVTFAETFLLETLRPI